MEEPELGLHPDVVGKLAGLLKVAADRTQLIITTHSSTLVDHLTDMPEAVVVFGKQNGATTMERLRPEKLQAWLRDYNDSLGALWTSGEIGGNRW
jgi:predicted ATPase